MNALFVKFALGSVYTSSLDAEVMVESAKEAYITYVIDGIEGEIEIRGPLAKRISQAIASQLVVPQ